MTERLINTSHGTNRQAFAGLDWALFIGLALIWGASFLFMAMGLDNFHPGLVTFLRVGFGAATLSFFPKTRGVAFATRDSRRVAFLGIIWLAIPLTLFPIAQQWIDSSVAGMLNGATPVFTALLAIFLLRQAPRMIQIIGLVLGFAGITAIALPSAGSGTTQAIGVVLILIATICYAVSLNMVAPLQQTYGALPVIARAQWIATALVTPFGIYGLLNSGFGWSSLLAMLAVGALGTGIAFAMMGTLSGRVGATRSSFLTYLIPVVALVLGVVFRDEIAEPVAVAGVFMVIAGAFLASRKEV